MTKQLILSAALAAILACATSTPVQAQNAVPKILKKVPPDFPGEAIRRGIDKGVLKAKLTVDGGGSVTNVAILEAQPAKAKILSEAVSEALNKWKFEGSGKDASFELQIVLTAE